MSSPPAPTVAAIAAGLSGVTLPVALMQGNLAKVALRPNSYTAYAVGSSTTSLIVQSNPENKDGANPIVTLTVPPGTVQGASVQSVVYGKVVGVRFRSDANSAPFSVVIDGVSYAVPNAPYRWNGLTSTTVDGDCYRIIASSLSDGPHSVEVVLAADPLGITTYALSIYGFIAEERVGYKERPSIQGIAGQGLLTGSAVAIPGTAAGIVGMRRVIYTNTGATAAAVTVLYGGAVVWQSFLAATGSAGSSDVFDPGDYTAASQYTHTGGTSVRYTVYGR